MKETTARQIENMKDQTIGVEVRFEKKDFHTQKELRTRNFSALFFGFGV